MRCDANVMILILLLCARSAVIRYFDVSASSATRLWRWDINPRVEVDHDDRSLIRMLH